MILRSGRVCPNADHEAGNLLLKCSFGWGPSVMSRSLVLKDLLMQAHTGELI